MRSSSRTSGFDRGPAASHGTTDGDLTDPSCLLLERRDCADQKWARNALRNGGCAPGSAPEAQVEGMRKARPRVRFGGMIPYRRLRCICCSMAVLMDEAGYDTVGKGVNSD